MSLLLPKKSPLAPWIVCGVAALFFFYEIFQLAIFNVIDHDLMTYYNISPAGLGAFSSSYFYANILVIFPVGILLERVSTRRFILVMLAVVTLGTFLFAFTTSFPLAILSRGLVGLGNAISVLAAMRLATRWFPQNRWALVIGLIITVGMLGGIVAQEPFEYLVHLVSWHHAIFFVGILGIIIFILNWLFVEDYPATAESVHQAAEAEWETLGFFGSIREAFKFPQSWLCALYTGLMNLPVFVLAVLWGNMYLIDGVGLNETTAAQIVSMIFIGMIIGSPLMGWISDRLQSRKMPMIIGAISITVVTFIIIYGGHLSVTAFIVLFFLLGLFSSLQSLSYPFLAENIPPAFTSISMSIVSIILNLSSAICQPLFGALLSHSQKATETVIGVTSNYSLISFQHAMLLLPLGYLIGFIAMLFVKKIKKS